MAEQMNFAVLYKKLMDCHFSPDQQRSDAVLDAILRQLPSACPQTERKPSMGERERPEGINGINMESGCQHEEE